MSSARLFRKATQSSLPQLPLMVAPSWKLKPFDDSRVQRLSREAGLHPLIAQLLLQRGIADAPSSRAYFEVRRDGLHDPALLPGIAEAADRLARAIREGRKIVVYGDYDVDGVCGTSLLWDCLRLVGARELAYYIPHRIDEGYGLSGEALRRLASEQGATVVVTVDCGVTAVAEARLARSLGIELIVTDHHTPGPDWPEADTVVHPRAPGGQYPFPDLCGAGVAFKLAWQLCKSLGDGQKASPHLRQFLVRAMNLVALATVADVVPLEDENRIFVRHGLRGLVKEPSVGLRALMEVAGCAGREALTTGTIGFGLAPRINAAGRMERAMAAVELLTTDDPVRAAEIALGLELCNRKRQELERAIVAQAHAMIDAQGGLGERGGIVLGHADWHAGVIGIVASRLVDAYHRPAIVVALGADCGQGSGRSIPGFDLHAALSACADELTAFGGHKAAAGLKLRPESLDAFAARFDSYCRDVLTPEQRTKVLPIDAQVPLGLLTHKVVEQVESLEPFGLGNPRPVLMAEPVRLASEPRKVGDGGVHVQLRVEQGGTTLPAIGWNMAQRLNGLKPGTPCAIAFFPMIDTWRERREVKLELKDLRVLDPDSEP
jgi:single-stranded-DNA-specific exonuclease